MVTDGGVNAPQCLEFGGVVNSGCESIWPRNYREALACQQALQNKLRLTPLERPPQLVAGVDAAYDKNRPALFGAAVVMSLPELQIVEKVAVTGEVSFPYIPGMLTFREAPIILTALSRLQRQPDVILVDGQGIAHPRGLGLASHLGLLIGKPTIGCAKSRLIGTSENLGREAGSVNPLQWEGKIIGLVWRSKLRCNPLYISPGHLITLEEALRVAQQCLGKYRLPLPLREAHLLSQQQRQQAGSNQ